VAESALSSNEHLPHLAKPPITWITRVPATVRDAPAAVAQVAPQAMQPLPEGYRAQALPSRYGGVAQRGRLIASAPRQPQARRTVETHRLQQRAQDRTAWQQLCGTALACAAEAQQAQARFAQGVRATYLHTRTVRAQPRYGNRGRPGRDAHPDQVFSQVDGALASSRAGRQGRGDQHSCCILATHALADTPLSPPEVLSGYKGQGQAERGCRCLPAPQFLAAARSLKQPARSMALVMVLTGCL